MGGRSNNGSRNTSTETVSDFLNRAVNGESYRISVKANDMQAIVGTKSEVLEKLAKWQAKTKTKLYFAGFDMADNYISIDASYTEDQAKRALEWRKNNR